jgi:hypothetical protein
MSVDIVAENALPGTFSLAQMFPGNTQGDMSVPGFARQISYNIGETVQFCIHGAPSEIRIFRAGWYGGTTGFRQITTIQNQSTNQPDGTVVSGSYGATTSTAWSVTATWTIPQTAVSGIYMAMVRNASNTDAFYITFVVRDDDAVADIIYKTSDTTWGAAYNHWGLTSAPNGKNLYGSGTGVGNIMERSTMVSYHRPVITRGTVMQTYWWACELPLIRFLERNGYSVKYVSSVDLDKKGSSLLSGKGSVFLSSGHDEYWTTNMRNAVEEWRDLSGGHSLFLSGNEVFWRTRFEYVGDEVRMWCYKDSMPGPTGVSRVAGAPFDPVSWTGTWKDTRWPDRKPEWFLTGTDFGMNGVYDYNAVVPKNPYGGLKVWGGTSLVDSDITFSGVIGFEADHARPTQPTGSYSILASYTRAAPGGLSDVNGEKYDVPGNIEWGIVAQRYSSGALTVGFGTCQWAWTLDATHDREWGGGVSLDAQKFTVNLLNDLGAEPQSLMGTIVLRAKTPLDDYGRIPNSTGEPEEPEQPAAQSTFFLGDGTELTPFILRNGQLVELDSDYIAPMIEMALTVNGNGDFALTGTAVRVTSSTDYEITGSNVVDHGDDTWTIST